MWLGTNNIDKANIEIIAATFAIFQIESDHNWIYT